MDNPIIRLSIRLAKKKFFKLTFLCLSFGGFRAEENIRMIALGFENKSLFWHPMFLWNNWRAFLYLLRFINSDMKLIWRSDGTRLCINVQNIESFHTCNPNANFIPSGKHKYNETTMVASVLCVCVCVGWVEGGCLCALTSFTFQTICQLVHCRLSPSSHIIYSSDL
jgi:hypothetical protein